MNQIEIGRFIAQKRRERNLTQEQLAERIGVSNKTVSKWECGKCMPDYSVIEPLCAELGITVSELMSGAESKHGGERSVTVYHEGRNVIVKSAKTGITFGSALAMVISYTAWKSVGWAILHGIFSWAYVIYYLIRY